MQVTAGQDRGESNLDGIDAIHKVSTINSASIDSSPNQV